ncbi:hypothetical protein ACFFSW_17495 [Saccharothrix longispora]|uniref:Uncharacterized protein n=1 Tax=Saccharothrix longispora TaxID=33920 RepID=A0ABU1PQ53_9PSEU|nr:hypothetical protein [Saccharothrix longispora]MDR6592596.1 hypothetical protein [Saccharothrix longispora]
MSTLPVDTSPIAQTVIGCVLVEADERLPERYGVPWTPMSFFHRDGGHRAVVVQSPGTAVGPRGRAPAVQPGRRSGEIESPEKGNP